ncbi:MAG: metal-dependent hydrolase [Fretibacterium sp.]|nr:metal-dependent hydrolase [Fretibacterium sp.]
MTGRGHRLVTFMAVGGTTGSPLAAVFSLMGAALPDTLERFFPRRTRNRYHRKFTHWFVPWLLLALFCFYRAQWNLPSVAVLMGGGEGALWSCVAFWLMGALMHILEDACCGKVPLLNPMRRSFGVHLFHMSSEMGEMSAGEMAFSLVVVLLSLAAWVKQGIML